MKKNNKSVKNTKSFLGNPPALVNTTFFVPAANLNNNDGIFTNLHDNPSNFSSSNQDPNWGFDISNKIFAQSDKKKIFSDDKFKNMLSNNQDTYTGDLFSEDFAPVVDNYNDAVQAVSPVLSEVNFPSYYATVEPQPVSVGIAPVDANYFAPASVYATTTSEIGDTFLGADVLKQAQQSGSDFIATREVGNTFAGSDLLQQTTSNDGLVSQSVEIKSSGDVLSHPEMGDIVIQHPVDPLPDKNNVSTASIQPTTVEDDKKAKKTYNWLPIVLVVAAVGGYMYYNRKK